MPPEPTADQRAAEIIADLNEHGSVQPEKVLAEAIRDAEARGRRAGLEEGAAERKSLETALAGVRDAIAKASGDANDPAVAVQKLARDKGAVALAATLRKLAAP